MGGRNTDLFAADLPEGLQYRRDFISGDEEQALLEELGRLEFSTFEMRGVIARRRVAFFGGNYEGNPRPSAPLPEFLRPLRARVGAWLSRDPEAFSMALVNEYRPGAPIGWHRDAPQYAIVVGVSLLSACRMTFRPYRSQAEDPAIRKRRVATHQLILEPRSAYVLDGAARTAYEHHIPSVASLRYSITFRTFRTPR